MSEATIEDRPTARTLAAALQIDPQTRRKYKEEGWWGDDTVTRWIAENVACGGGRPAAITADGQLSYAELADKANRFARGLRSLGVRPGDVVSVQLSNEPAFLIAYFGITRLGAVLSTVHAPYRTAEIRTLLKHNTCVAFIGYTTQKDFSPVAEVLALKPDLPALRHVIAVGDATTGAIPFDTLMDAPPLPPGEFTPSPNDPFLLLFTSGTSSSPKAVPLSYEITLGNARVGVEEHGFRDTDRVLSVAPFTHLLGLYSLHLATRVGAANVLFQAFTPAELSAAIAHHRPTVIVCASPHLAAMMNTGQLTKTDMSGVRLIISSGAALAPDVAKAVFAALPNGFLTNLWGMTELQAGLYTRPGDRMEIATKTSGRAAPGAEIRIADFDSQPLTAGNEGELQIRGSLVFPGYYKNDAANRQAFSEDGWFRTGDLAVMDTDGNVSITGRMTDIINRGGIKYNPLDIENILIGHPKVAQVAVVGYPDSLLGQRACCFVVPNGRTAPTLEELCARLLEQGVSKVKLPERLEIIDEMPITPTRKIIKGRLRERLKG